ncbi:hypothetical protein C1645_817197 [Glomus cerebriforme]|uniref:F-box domain-containing protein n=1 Tax=Glomus cerebriforme TaxID=658196 RepID=A0A397TA17_9GLOM|nr:hypothetical protein C1645_817197 [Glomus cerebriforme]
MSDIFFVNYELHDNKSFYSCLLVDKTWCEIIIPILWKNPWKLLKEEKEKSLLNVIISHLSDKSRNNLSQDIDFLTNSYQRPLFNYISFCKHLNFNRIIKIIDTLIPFEECKISIKNEIFNLFINKDMKYSHLYIPEEFDFQIHLIPGFKHCFSEIKFLSCYIKINDNVLIRLTEIIESIKELDLFIQENNNNYGFGRIKEIQKGLFNVYLTITAQHSRFDESFYNILERPLIKHTNNIQNLKLIKESIPLGSYDSTYYAWNCLENLSLPYLKTLKARQILTGPLISLIKNTNEYLNEINIVNTNYKEYSLFYDKELIQVIYQNCPKLKYLKLSVKSQNILEFEKILINCQYLSKLAINTPALVYFNWDDLFKILTKSSPDSLFNFEFNNSSIRSPIKLEFLNLFFENWKGRLPMILQISLENLKGFKELVEKYKAAGVIKNIKYTL